LNGFQRGELARRAGCNLETVRYYEKIGLLAGTAAHGQRLSYL
jgi:DNA-binding transcriptional MerR regulator